MKKIIARMRGGLGNQLFIIAFAFYVRRLNYTDCPILVDVREYNRYKVRNFELLSLIKEDSISFFTNHFSIFYDVTRELFHIDQKLNRKDTKSLSWLSKYGLYYGRRSAIGAKQALTTTSYIYGYFQDAEMVFKVRDELITHIISPVKSKSFTSNNRVAVSIRCGDDYIKQGWPICTKEYYQKGLNYILEKKRFGKDVQILVFSDVVEKAKKIINDNRAVFVCDLSPSEQLTIMAQCNDFVIANSSFSWWGALLGLKKDSIVVMPEFWYSTREKTINTRLYYEKATIICD